MYAVITARARANKLGPATPVTALQHSPSARDAGPWSASAMLLTKARTVSWSAVHGSSTIPSDSLMGACFRAAVATRRMYPSSRFRVLLASFVESDRALEGGMYIF